MFSFAKKLVDRFEGSSSDDARADSYFKNALQLNNKGYALRVLSVVPHSLAHQLGFESWFDYIIRVNQHELPMMYPSLSNYAYNINEDGSINYGGQTTQEQAGMINFELLLQELVSIVKNPNGTKSVIFDVWSAKGGIIRQIVVPLEAFDAASSAPELTAQALFADNFKQIGLLVQSQHLNTATYVWRILNTHANLPAFQAKLVPYSDYIIGCDSTFARDVHGKGLLSVGGEALLSRTVLSYYNHHYSVTQEDHIPITLYVYNHDYDVLRPVTVNLSRGWGSGQNRGILGCDVGYGLIHRLPEVIGKFEHNDIIDDVLFENTQSFDYNLGQPSQEVVNEAPAPLPVEESPNEFVPVAPASVVPPPPKAGKKKKHATSLAALEGLSDYMNEELAKSKEAEVQYLNTNPELEPAPPPPKAS